MTADDDADAERAGSGLVVNHRADLRQRLAERASRTGDHGVALTEREHGGGKGVAVLVDHPLGFAPKHAVALALAVEEIDSAAH